MRDRSYRLQTSDGSRLSDSLTGQFFEIDRGVVEVVLGILEDHGSIGVPESASHFAWHPGNERVRGNHGLLRNHGSGCDDGTLANAGVVQNGSANTNENCVLKRT